MTRSQVRFLLGTPMVIDSFDADRWTTCTACGAVTSARSRAAISSSGSTATRSRASKSRSRCRVPSQRRQLNSSASSGPHARAAPPRLRILDERTQDFDPVAGRQHAVARHFTPEDPDAAGRGVDGWMQGQDPGSLNGLARGAPGGNLEGSTVWRSASAQATSIAIVSAATETPAARGARMRPRGGCRRFRRRGRAQAPRSRPESRIGPARSTRVPASRSARSPIDPRVRQMGHPRGSS
jgi:hypothetical protein